MRRTGPAALFGLAVVGAAGGWLLQVGLASAGAPTYIPPPTLYSVLFVLAAGMLLLGRPVRRLVRGTTTRHVDPFFAMRVLMLAKASSLTGALLVGAVAAWLVYAITRSDSIATPAFWPDIVTGVGATALGVAGLIVEWWCRIPPQDDADLPETAMDHR